jgi:CubicO group peptidase (beta-lactamase class C family)
MNARIPGYRFPLLAVAVTLLVAVPSLPAQEPDTPQERVDRIMAAYASPESPGAVVAVVRNGEVVFDRAYGMANLTHQVPLTVDTRGNLASTAKQFTAFAVALLAEQGRLGLDDDVRVHIPELPDLGETVTLRHLLTHTSGYREFLNALAIGGWRIEDLDHIDRHEALEVVRRQPTLQNSPGAEYNYNNTGYVLLAMVVERVTEQSFADWLRANLFTPLGMTATVVREHPRQLVPGAAQGYAPAGAGGAFNEAPDMGGGLGAGDIYSTVGDLARWMTNLGTGDLGGRAVLEAMTTRNVLTTGDTTPYGLGLYVRTVRGLRMIEHGGGEMGHRSHFRYYPDLDAGLIVLSNHGRFDGSIPGRIAEVFFGEHMAPREELAAATPPSAVALAAATELFDPASFDPASFAVYAGRYAVTIQPGMVLSFRREGDRLLVEPTGQTAVELRPTSDATFSVPEAASAVTFHKDPTGAVTGLTWHQAGADFQALRLPDDEAPLDLAAYQGRYYSTEFETYYTVTAGEDHLVVDHRRRDPVTLKHGHGDAFVGGFPLVQVEFERDEGGAVVAFRVGNIRARDVRFERVRSPGP